MENLNDFNKIYKYYFAFGGVYLVHYGYEDFVLVDYFNSFNYDEIWPNPTNKPKRLFNLNSMTFMNRP